MDWEQARTYAEKWAGARLPSEAEWEYAARSAGENHLYPWGDEKATCTRAVMYDGGNGCGRNATWPVRSKPTGVSAQGVHDLAGNVWEWVQDEYVNSYTGAPADGSAREDTGSTRVKRGGSWNDGAELARAAPRFFGHPGLGDANLGFRPARSPAP